MYDQGEIEMGLGPLVVGIGTPSCWDWGSLLLGLTPFVAHFGDLQVIKFLVFCCFGVFAKVSLL